MLFTWLNFAGILFEVVVFLGWIFFKILDLWSHGWPWPQIFRVKFLKTCISWMYGLIDVKQKGSNTLIWFWANYVTSTFYHSRNLDLGFSRSYSEIAISQDWHRRKGIWLHGILDSLCDLEFWPCPKTLTLGFWILFPCMKNRYDISAWRFFYPSFLI